MSLIISALPGRIRVRDTALRQPDRLARLRTALAGLTGVLSAQGNAGAGSILLHYDTSRIEPTTMEAAVDRAVDTELSQPRPLLKPALRVRVNRYAKRGMLGSLGLSMALAAVGNKRWHAVSGGVFLACLLLHVTVHHRHVLR